MENTIEKICDESSTKNKSSFWKCWKFKKLGSFVGGLWNIYLFYIILIIKYYQVFLKWAIPWGNEWKMSPTLEWWIENLKNIK